MITCVKNQLRRLLPKNAFARGVSVLVGGTASAQVLLVLAAPLLTRLYSPEDFGLLAVYASSLALIGAISSLRYEMAIPLPEDDGEAANVAVLCLLLVVISALLTGVLALVMGSAIASALGVPTLVRYLWLLPFGVLLTGFYGVFNYWAVRTRRFTTIAGTKLCQAVATIAIQLAAFQLSALGLLIAQVAGQGAGMAILAGAGYKNMINSFNLRNLYAVAKRYKRFPLYSSNAGVFQTLYSQSPAIVLASFGHVSVSGLWLLAERVAAAPQSVISSSINQAIHKDLVEARNTNSVGTRIAPLIEGMATLAVPPAVLLVFFGSSISPFVLGGAWIEIGEIFKYVITLATVSFIFSPMSTVVSVMGWQKSGMWFQFSKTLVTTAVLIFFLILDQPFQSIAAYCITSIMIIFLYRLYLLHMLGVKYCRLLLRILEAIVGYSMLSVGLLILLETDLNSLLKNLALVILSIFTIILYFSSLIRLVNTRQNYKP